MSACLGNPRVLCGLLLAGSVVASVAQSRAATPGKGPWTPDLAQLLGLAGTASPPQRTAEDEVVPAAAAERNPLLADAASGARGSKGALADALQRAHDLSAQAATASRLKAPDEVLPEAIRSIVAGLRARSDGLVMLASDSTAAEGESLIRQKSIEVARDSEAVIARNPASPPIE